MSTAFRTLLSASDLQPRLQDPSSAMIDCRFDLDDHSRGQAAYLKGHIPGAVNRPWQADPGPYGRFLPAASPRADFEALPGGASPKETVVYCGSGVTAAHNLLALEYAGLQGARPYPGSWSE